VKMAPRFASVWSAALTVVLVICAIAVDVTAGTESAAPGTNDPIPTTDSPTAGPPTAAPSTAAPSTPPGNNNTAKPTTVTASRSVSTSRSATLTIRLPPPPTRKPTRTQTQTVIPPTPVPTTPAPTLNADDLLYDDFEFYAAVVVPSMLSTFDPDIFAMQVRAAANAVSSTLPPRYRLLGYCGIELPEDAARNTQGWAGALCDAGIGSVDAPNTLAKFAFQGSKGDVYTELFDGDGIEVVTVGTVKLFAVLQPGARQPVPTPAGPSTAEEISGAVTSPVGMAVTIVLVLLIICCCCLAGRLYCLGEKEKKLIQQQEELERRNGGGGGRGGVGSPSEEELRSIEGTRSAPRPGGLTANDDDDDDGARQVSVPPTGLARGLYEDDGESPGPDRNSPKDVGGPPASFGAVAGASGSPSASGAERKAFIPMPMASTQSLTGSARHAGSSPPASDSSARAPPPAALWSGEAQQPNAAPQPHAAHTSASTSLFMQGSVASTGPNPQLTPNAPLPPLGGPVAASSPHSQTSRSSALAPPFSAAPPAKAAHHHSSPLAAADQSRSLFGDDDDGPPPPTFDAVAVASPPPPASPPRADPLDALFAPATQQPQQPQHHHHSGSDRHSAYSSPDASASLF
jgi:hypothetical protein